MISVLPLIMGLTRKKSDGIRRNRWYLLTRLDPLPEMTLAHATCANIFHRLFGMGVARLGFPVLLSMFTALGVFSHVNKGEIFITQVVLAGDIQPLLQCLQA